MGGIEYEGGRWSYDSRLVRVGTRMRTTSKVEEEGGEENWNLEEY